MPSKRSTKTVSPAPADELADDFLSAVAADAPLADRDGVFVAPTDDAPSLEGVIADLEPLSNQMRATVAEIGLLDIVRATPAQRSVLMSLRAELDKARKDLSTWVDAIDISIRQAAIDMGADEIPLADGVVRIEAPRGEWVVNLPHLRDELKPLVDSGLVTQAEYEALFTTKVEEKADNAKLNYLAKHRGGHVADAINRSQVWKEGNPMGARITVQRAR